MEYNFTGNKRIGFIHLISYTGMAFGLFMISIGRVMPYHVNSIRFKDNRVKDHSVGKLLGLGLGWGLRLHRCS